MPYVAIIRNNHGLGASVHITEEDAKQSLVGTLVADSFEGVTDFDSLDDLPDDQESWECDVHEISLSLFENVDDVIVRLALITRDSTLADQARRRTFSAWWNDNNEGDQVAESLPPFIYDIRQEALLAMGEDESPLTKDNIPAGFWDALTTYWSN